MENSNEATLLFNKLVESNNANHNSSIVLTNQIKVLLDNTKVIQWDLKQLNVLLENYKKDTEMENIKRLNFLEKIPSHIEAKLSKDLNKSISSLESNGKYLKYLFTSIITTSLLSIIILFGGVYLAKQWFVESVKTKTEARQDILNELEKNNNMIVKKDYLIALKNERKMIKNWSQSNPNDSKSYQSFRSGIISANSKQNIIKNLKDDEIIGK